MSTTMMKPVEFDLTFPSNVFKDGAQNFFLGICHPKFDINVRCSDVDSLVDAKIISGNNWFFLSNTTSLYPENNSVLYGERDQYGLYSEASIFSGYILEPSLHPFCPREMVCSYFHKNVNGSHNGVFSFVKISDYGRKIEFITDAFGISPLYYRYLNGAIIFSSNPRYLTTNADPPDYFAWRGLVQSGFISSDRTLSVGVKRFPAGSRMTITGAGSHLSSWFDFSSLPSGEKDITDSAIKEIEYAFQKSMEKCLNLIPNMSYLPLSSGYDSRRILTYLHNKKFFFQSATVRVLQKGGLDLDAQFANKMAKDLFFQHKVVELPTIDGYVHNDLRRRRSVDSECLIHTWYLSLVDALPSQPLLIFDGLAGDVLGETGFELCDLYKGTKANRLRNLSETAYSYEFDNLFSRSHVPHVTEVRDDLQLYLDFLPDTPNMADLAFLLLRTRRTIAMGACQLIPLGHLVVFPYLDMNYIKLAMQYNPLQKIKKSIQARCLEEFWPKYFAYNGSRNIPNGYVSATKDYSKERLMGVVRSLQKEVNIRNGYSDLLSILSNRAKLIVLLSQFNSKILCGREWSFVPLLELQARQSSISPVWSTELE